MNSFKQLHWPLIIGMGALALIWPLMNITGMGGLGRILLTVLISAAWLAIVVFFRVREPLLTLIFTGVTHGVFAIILSVVLLPILTNPFAIVAVLITNAIWGAAVGILAWVIQRMSSPQAL